MEIQIFSTPRGNPHCIGSFKGSFKAGVANLRRMRHKWRIAVGENISNKKRSTSKKKTKKTFHKLYLAISDDQLILGQKIGKLEIDSE